VSKTENIPAPAVRRLSLYLRQLETYLADGHLTVSSKQLGEALGLSGAQIRKDLACFGQFGHAGIGYRVAELIQQVRRILGMDRVAHVLLVGVGNLGRALLSFRGFGKYGFEIVAAFDNDSTKIGQRIPGPGGLVIQPLSEMPDAVRSQSIRLGILTVPAAAGQSAADDMVAAGVRAILNFAPVNLKIGSRAVVSSVDLGVSLAQLSFLLNGATN
jgi:redox-sensing transcriptional repressor